MMIAVDRGVGRETGEGHLQNSSQVPAGDAVGALASRIRDVRTASQASVTTTDGE
jgi:hypothetical protein